MKKLSYLLLILLAIGCQKQKGVLPQQAKKLVGKWEPIAREITLGNGVKEWKSLDSIPNKRGFVFRSNGVFLDWDGKPACCGPTGKFTINGEAFFPKIDKKADCSLVLCISASLTCQNHQLQIDKNELIWSRCGDRSRYRRLD